MQLPILLHIAFMILAAGLIVSAAIIAKQRKTGWLARHKALALTGAVSALVASGIMVAYKISVGFPHLSSPHAIAGAITLSLVLVTPILGALIPNGNKKIRPLHKTMGRVTSASITVTALMGVGRWIQFFRK